MIKLSKSFASLLVLLTVLFSCFAPVAPAFAQEPAQVHITIVATSDLHGHIYPWDYAVDEADPDTGYGKIATVVKQIRAENPNTIVVDAGDTIQDNMAELFNDEPVHPMIQAMNMIGYDTWTLGNHEFNYGLGLLNKAIAGSKATVLGGNIYKEDGTRFVNAYAIKETGGIKVGIVGMTPPHIPIWEAGTPENFKGLTFKDPTEETKKAIAELQGKVDLIIGVMHLGEEGEYGVEGSGLAALTKANPEFTVVVGGHAHARVDGKDLNGVLFVEPGAYGNRVDRVDLTLEKKDGIWQVIDKKAQAIDTTNIAMDPEIEAVFKPYHEKARANANTVVGKVAADYLPEPWFLPGIPTAQIQDTALIDLINEVQLKYSGADVSAAALFSTISDLNPGDFKKKDVANIYKYDNTLQAVKITGKKLKEYMEWSAKYFNTAKPGDLTISFNPNIRAYNYDMFAGINYEIDISQPEGQRIKNVTFKGQPLADDTVLTLAINNYRFGTLKSLGIVTPDDIVFDSYKKWGDKGRIRDLIVQYVTEKGTVTPACDNNWKIVGFDPNLPEKDSVYTLIKAGIIKIPASEDGRTPNVKSINIADVKAQFAGKVAIFHTNDTHGRLEEGAYDGMGFAKLASIIKAYKTLNPNVLVLDAGDTFHGLPVATINKGESVVNVLNAIGYDAMTPGNHDFNYGYQRLLELAGMAKFPVLSANVLQADGTNLLPAYTIKEVNGLKVGIFGLSTPETAYKTHPDNVRGLTFADPIETAKQMVNELKGKTDVIVALAHLGLDASSEITSQKVAQAVPGIDIIVDGHSHSELKDGLLVGNTLIVSANEYDKYLGFVELTVENNKITAKKAAPIAKSAGTLVSADPVVKQVIAEAKAAFDKIGSEVIGKTDILLEGTRDKVRTGETNLGNLINDAILALTKADIAFTNGGNIRTSIEPGEITRSEIINVLPFGNIVVTKKVSGKDVLAALELGVSAYPASLGGFPHVGGMTFAFDPTKPVGQRVYDVKVKGQPLDLNKTYTFATNDFIAAGGDNYTMLKDLPKIAEYGALDEVVANYIKSKGTVHPVVEGRVVVGTAPASAPAPAPAPVPAAKKYVVKPGDVLWKIAKQFGLTWEKLAEFNKLANPHLIFPGQTILVPAQ